jgi:aspartate/methionine/tyrosine aminotransferase
VYERLVFEDDVSIAPSFARLAHDRRRLIVVNSFSKTYNMTGWRLGYAVVSEELARLMTKLEEFVVSNPPAMAQRAGITALRDGEPYVQGLLEKYGRRRQVVVERLRAIPQVTLPDPVGGFYAFPKLEGLGDSLAFAKRLLLEARVGTVPGIAFGASGEGHLRLCFAASEEILVPALDAFADFVGRNLGD